MFMLQKVSVSSTELWCVQIWTEGGCRVVRASHSSGADRLPGRCMYQYQCVCCECQLARDQGR